jgi:hypothetical protein
LGAAKIQRVYSKNGYIPKMFEPYNCAEVIDVAPTLTAHSNGSTTHCGTVLIIEEENNTETLIKREV